MGRRKKVKNDVNHFSANLSYYDQGETQKFFSARATAKDGKRLSRKFHLSDYEDSYALAKTAAEYWIEDHDYDPRTEVKHSFIKLLDSGMGYRLKFTCAAGKVIKTYTVQRHGSMEEARELAEADGDRAIANPVQFVREENGIKKRKAYAPRTNHEKSEYGIQYMPCETGGRFVPRVTIYPIDLNEEKHVATKVFTIAEYGNEQEALEAAREWRRTIIKIQENRKRLKRRERAKTQEEKERIQLLFEIKEPEFLGKYKGGDIKLVQREVYLEAIYL